MQEKKIGPELRFLNNQIKRCFQNSPEKKHADSVTGTNGWIIGYIRCHSDRDIYQRDLEKQFSITRSTASRVISLMERKGLVQRESVPGDARLKKLVLTQKALEIGEMMDRRGAEIEKKLTAGFTGQELAQLLSYIQRMKDNLEPPVLQPLQTIQQKPRR